MSNALRRASLLWLAARAGSRAARAQRRRRLALALFGDRRVLPLFLQGGAPPPLWKTGDKSYAEILKWWAGKKVLPADTFADLADELKGRAGRLARIYNTSFTQAIYDSLGKAIAQGQTWKDWSKSAQQLLDGYMAAGPQKDRLYTGDKWSPWYAELVYRNATASAYHAGKYAEMFAPEWMEAAPYWLYSAIHDHRTRPEHRVLDGLVFRKDDARGRHFLPPLGHNCRCSSVEIDDEALKEGGYKVTPGSSVEFQPPKGWDADRVESLVPKTLKNWKARQVPAADDVSRRNAAEVAARAASSAAAALSPRARLEALLTAASGDTVVTTRDVFGALRDALSDFPVLPEQASYPEVLAAMRDAQSAGFGYETRAIATSEAGGFLKGEVRTQALTNYLQPDTPVFASAVRYGGVLYVEPAPWAAAIARDLPVVNADVLDLDAFLLRREIAAAANTPMRRLTEALGGEAAFERYAAPVRRLAVLKEETQAAFKVLSDYETLLVRDGIFANRYFDPTSGRLSIRLRAGGSIDPSKLARYERAIKKAFANHKRLEAATAKLAARVQKQSGRIGKKLERFLALPSIGGVDLSAAVALSFEPGLDARIVTRTLEGATRFARIVNRKLFGPNGPPSLSVGLAPTGRAFQRGGGIFLGLLDERIEVVAHEMGHWLEEIGPGVHEKVLAFLRKRTIGETAVRLSDLMPGHPFGPLEFARPDKFISAYMGKDYNGAATEILSMGIELLVSKPLELAARDPEYFDFILALIRGDI